MPATLADFLRGQRRNFTENGVESPALSAELLLAHALGLSRSELLHRLIMSPLAELPEQAEETFNQLALRRLRGEPVAYLLGSREFYGREFQVDRSTLIPRPETEIIIDEALKIFGPHNSGAGGSRPKTGSFADLGTGSGCLAVTLALELPDWSGLAVDICASALEAARRNAVKFGVSERLEFVPADFRKLRLPPGALDLLVSNPPYVSEAEYRNLDGGVRDYEPKNALVPHDAAGPEPGKPHGERSGVPKAAEKTGLEYLAGICASASAALKSGGLLLMEIGHTQGGYMRELLAADSAWRETKIIKDLAGLDRIVFAVKS